MKCPEGKKNHTPDEAMQYKSFYVELVDSNPAWRKIITEDVTPKSNWLWVSVI